MARGEPTICLGCHADFASFLHVASCGTAYSAPRGRKHASEGEGIIPLGEGALTPADIAYYRSVERRAGPPITRALSATRDRDEAIRKATQ